MERVSPCHKGRGLTFNLDTFLGGWLLGDNLVVCKKFKSDNHISLSFLDQWRLKLIESFGTATIDWASIIVDGCSIKSRRSNSC